ncbi:hypothetical protein HK096_003874 [Nowakowskiella sp. JEL0078]|nr:hypothetical protein HK096_003874 [Nowakowskiella sp. JEL0078]
MIAILAVFVLLALNPATISAAVFPRATECYGDCVTRCNAKSTAAEIATCLTGCAGKAACTTSTTKTTTTTKASTTSTKVTSTTKASTTSTKTTTGAASTATAAAGSPIGYATLNGGTTGGAGGSTVTVSTAADFVSAAQADGKAIIYLNGFFSNVGRIDVAADKTIIGVGSSSGFIGSSLFIKTGNVIVRNLKMQKCLGGDDDCITIQACNNVWVDHCDLSGDLAADKDTYDGLVDVSHAASFITISNNYFHDHHKTSLIGHSDSSKYDDASIKVTYYGNYFSNIGSRLPSIRFGTAHIFDNYYENILVSGINTRMGAQVLVENNVFVNALLPATSIDSDKVGYCVLHGNDFGGAVADCPTGTLNSITAYSYTLQATSSVAASVKANAGTGKI